MAFHHEKPQTHENSVFFCRRLTGNFVPDEAPWMGVNLSLSVTAEGRIRQNAEGKDLETSSDIQCSP